MDKKPLAIKMEKPGKRGSNFSERENVAVLAGVNEHYSVLTHASKAAQACRQKRQAWAEITNNVNAVGGRGRSQDGVNKRWKDMRDAVKNHPRQARQTGAGPPVPPAPYEDAVLAILAGSSIVDGIVPQDQGDTFVLKSNSQSEHASEEPPCTCNNIEMSNNDDVLVEESPLTPSTSTATRNPHPGMMKKRTAGKSASIKSFDTAESPVDKKDRVMQKWMTSEVQKNEMKKKLMIQQILLICRKKKSLSQNSWSSVLLR